MKNNIPAYTLQREPVAGRKTWELVQRMDYRTILVSKVLGNDGAKFRSVQAELASLYEDGDNIYNMMVRLPVRDMSPARDMDQLYMPSQCLIHSIDPDGSMSVDELRFLVSPRFTM